MNGLLKKGLIAGLAIVAGYQIYKVATKPKGAEKKSSASGKKSQSGELKYDKQTGKVYKLKVDGFDSKWILLSSDQQPKAMSWYNFNNKWYWVKWNGKIEA